MTAALTSAEILQRSRPAGYHALCQASAFFLAPIALLLVLAYVHGTWNGVMQLERYLLWGVLWWVVAGLAWRAAQRIKNSPDFVDENVLRPPHRPALFLRILLIPLSLVLLVLCAAAVWGMGRSVLQEYRFVVSSDSRTVEATAVSRQECRTQRGRRYGNRAGWAVRYTYTIEGVDYRFDSNCMNVDIADDIGDRITLRYSHRDPSAAHRIGSAKLGALMAMFTFLSLSTFGFSRIAWRRLR